MSSKRRIGFVGYGKINQYLVNAILSKGNLKESYEISFVWNRTFSVVENDARSDVNRLSNCILTLRCRYRILDSQKLSDLKNFLLYPCDLIVEAAHPDVVKEFGHLFVEVSSKQQQCIQSIY